MGGGAPCKVPRQQDASPGPRSLTEKSFPPWRLGRRGGWRGSRRARGTRVVDTRAHTRTHARASLQLCRGPGCPGRGSNGRLASEGHSCLPAPGKLGVPAPTPLGPRPRPGPLPQGPGHGDLRGWKPRARPGLTGDAGRGQAGAPRHLPSSFSSIAAGLCEWFPPIFSAGRRCYMPGGAGAAGCWAR